jgi:hypothetical protein
MRTVELVRTALFWPTWIGGAWLLHTHWAWSWLGAIGCAFGAGLVVMVVATLAFDRLFGD